MSTNQFNKKTIYDAIATLQQQNKDKMKEKNIKEQKKQEYNHDWGSSWQQKYHEVVAKINLEDTLEEEFKKANNMSHPTPQDLAEDNALYERVLRETKRAIRETGNDPFKEQPADVPGSDHQTEAVPDADVRAFKMADIDYNKIRYSTYGNGTTTANAPASHISPGEEGRKWSISDIMSEHPDWGIEQLMAERDLRNEPRENGSKRKPTKSTSPGYSQGFEPYFRSPEKQETTEGFSYRNIPPDFIYELGKRLSSGKHKEHMTFSEGFDEMKKHLCDLELVIEGRDPIHFKEETSDDHLAAISCELILLFKALNGC